MARESTESSCRPRSLLEFVESSSPGSPDSEESIEDSGRQLNSLQAPSDPSAEGGGIAQLHCVVYSFFGAAVWRHRLE